MLVLWGRLALLNSPPFRIPLEQLPRTPQDRITLSPALTGFGVALKKLIVQTTAGVRVVTERATDWGEFLPAAS